MSDRHQRWEPYEHNEDNQDRTVELELSRLLHRVTWTMPDSPPGVVEASIDVAMGRSRRQRRAQFVKVALVAACVGSMLTLAPVAGGWIGEGRQEVTTAPATPTASNDDLGSKLRYLLSASTRFENSETLQITSGIALPWVTDLTARFDPLDEALDAAVSSTGIGTVSYRIAGERVDVAVLVRQLDPTAAELESSEGSFRTSELAGVASTTDSGVLVVQESEKMRAQAGDTSGTHPAVATLVTDDGQVVSVLTKNHDVLSTDILAALVLDEAWLS